LGGSPQMGGKGPQFRKNDYFYMKFGLLTLYREGGTQVSHISF